jgi:alkanesulfonate monooxygenase SsuD/methylene tetrahydromethanopterin reductase-like flavin-dependent oxidoreductase (luciferase family)
MEFGMFHEFQRSKDQSETEAFDLSFEQVDAAEEWGLDVMWLAELHVAPTRSVLSAPLNVATAIAIRTRRMKIGTAVQVLPLCHPLRIAEEAATVDQISHGRSIFGGRAQRVSSHLPGLWHSLCRKPRALCRNPRHPEARLDRGQLLV